MYIFHFRRADKGGKHKKKSHHFFITAFVDSGVAAEINFKEYLLFVFDKNMVERYLIAFEHEETNFHIHIYFKFIYSYLLNEIREFILEFCNFDSFDIQSCRSPHATIKYISKSDLSLVTNIRESELHFNFRVHKWCERTKYFYHDDNFVVEHRFCYRYLEKYFYDHKLTLMSQVSMVSLENKYIPESWPWEVYNWWNEIVSNGISYRGSCLYLYGETTIGKSSVIEEVLGELFDRVFMPDVGKFFMTAFKEGFHKVILFEEFNSQYYVEDMLKRLCEGRKYSFPRKGISALTYTNDLPVIFVSNSAPVGSDAFLSRLRVINAVWKAWECVPTIDTSLSTSF